MDWDASICPSFCRALKALWGHQSIRWELPPSFFTLRLRPHRGVLGACDSWRLISRQLAAVQIYAWRSPSQAPPAPPSQPLNSCPGGPPTQGMRWAHHLQPSPAGSRGALHGPAHGTTHKPFTLCHTPPALSPPQEVSTKTCSLLPGK